MMDEAKRAKSPFKNIKAVIGGALIAGVIFVGVVGYHAAFPNYVAGGVRPIRKDDSTKYTMYAIMLAAAGFYIGTKAINGRTDKKK